jgi:hypothetical protein
MKRFNEFTIELLEEIYAIYAILKNLKPIIAEMRATEAGLKQD